MTPTKIDRPAVLKLLSLLPLVALCACAALTSNPTSVRNGVMTDPNGKTLYTFKKDKPLLSQCYDQCAVRWPSFNAPSKVAPAGDFETVLRADGSWQWAYKGQPLYRYSGDVAAGDVTGDGFKDVWFALRVQP